MPNFDGNILRWPEFWDIYESSVHRQDIPKVVKYSYLKGVLHGSAASAITGVPITNEGYDVAIQILQEKFGNKEEAIVEASYARLQRLPTVSNKFSDIKTHSSESRGQEEAGRTRRTSELFTGSTAVKLVNALNKPPLKLSLSYQRLSTF